MDITELTLIELQKNLQRQELTPEEVLESYLERIHKLNPKLNCYLEIFEDSARKQIQQLPKKNNRDEQKLFGIPIAVKDNICIEGQITSCASKILQNFISVYDATVIKKLKEAGAIFLGRTNMDEFAFGSSTENSAFGPTRNPYNPDYIPGGSSGGSAAAVAAHLAAGALGSDTGGSIRQPAGCCGIVGLKPTYGLVSRFGLIAFASSLDQIGPLARTVKDAALLLEVISGYDENDATSQPATPVNYHQEMEKIDIRKLRIGLPKEYFSGGLDSAIKQQFQNLIKKISGEVKIEEVSLPHSEYAVSVYYIIAPAEASANLARYDGIKYGLSHPEASDLLTTYTATRGTGFGPEVKRRIMLGTYALSAGYYEAYYGRAQKVRYLIRRDFENVFQKVDLLLAPTMPTPPFRLGEKIADPLLMYLSDIFTIPVNLAGLGAISLPLGFSSEGLPLGLQVIAPWWQETRMLAMANYLEKILNGQ